MSITESIKTSNVFSSVEYNKEVSYPYINNLPEVLKSVIHLFAEGTQIRTPIKDTQDALAPQEDTDNMDL